MSTIILLLSILLYVVLSVQVVPRAKVVLLVGCLLNAVGLTLFATEIAWNSPLIGLGGIALLMVVLVLVSIDRPKMQSLIRPSAGIAALLLSLGLLSPSGSTVALSLEWWLFGHLMLILFGYACFALGAMIGGIYIIVQVRLKQRSLEGISRYPALNTLDQYNFWCSLLGFSSLLTGVSAGVFWSLYDNAKLSWDVTVISSVLLLIWYATALASRYFGRRGRWAAWFSLLGFCALVIFIFLSSVVGDWHMG